VGIRAASGGGGATGRAAPPTPPVDYMPYATGSLCAPQPVVNRENVYAPNPLNSPLSGLATLHTGGVPASLSSFASPGSMGVGAASILTPGPRSVLASPHPSAKLLCALVFFSSSHAQSSAKAIRCVAHHQRPSQFPATRGGYRRVGYEVGCDEQCLRACSMRMLRRLRLVTRHARHAPCPSHAGLAAIGCRRLFLCAEAAANFNLLRLSTLSRAILRCVKQYQPPPPPRPSSATLLVTVAPLAAPTRSNRRRQAVCLFVEHLT
jgi:hypothetical protein